jgi:hypothetical protein
MKRKVTLYDTVQIPKGDINYELPIYLKSKNKESDKSEYHFIRQRADKSLMFPNQQDIITFYSSGHVSAFSGTIDDSDTDKLVSQCVEITEDEYNFSIQRAIDTLQGMMVGQMTARKVG